MKQTRFKRLMSALLSAVMLFTLCVPGISAAETAPSASQNLLGNPGFETADTSESAATGAWGRWNNAVRDSAEHHEGQYALKVSAGATGGSSSEQYIAGLTPGATYSFTIWAKLNKALADGAHAPEIGAKSVRTNPDTHKKEVVGQETKISVTATEWTQYKAEFVFQGEEACVYAWIDPAVANDIVLYADDASVTLKEGGTTPEQPDGPKVGGMIADPGFEKAALGPNKNPVVGNWNDYNYTRQQDVKHAGQWAVKSTPKVESTISMKVDGVIAGTVYELEAFVKGSQADQGNADPRLGVKGHGSAEKNIHLSLNDTDWTRNAVEFTYTSGTPEIYIWTAANNSNLSVFVDDMDMKAVKGLAAADFRNGEIAVKVAGHQGALTANEFTATYVVDGSEAQPLTLTAENATDSSITLKFNQIPAAAVDQNVTVTLSYGNTTKQNVSGSFVIAADASQVVVAEMVSAQIDNGTASVVLDKVPSPLPLARDFQITYTENGGEVKTAKVQSVTFNQENKTATVKFAPVEGSVLGAKNVVISVTYAGKTIAGEQFTIQQMNKRVFYVAANGNDEENNGLSKDAPFRTLAKLNTMTFQPGDEIRFRMGDTFSGTLRPQGSGAEGAPIIIASYSDGTSTAKPILSADGQWQGEIQKAGGGGHTPVETVTYRGTIWLENVEYYEVRDLELVDPMYNANDLRVNEIPFYSAGIRVVNKNMGDLYHYVFDNLTIHGFRAVGTNFGKSGGAIQFNVMVDSAHAEDATKNVESAMHDITVTNCNIYECGRSGINFLNPWGKREGEKWPGSQEGILPWYPFTNFYMANNIFHHIDGDALITDTVENAIIEKNLCYESAIHLGYMGAAVGFFNWNSTKNFFQYNEVFNVGKNASKQDGHNAPYYVVPGDAQGIEIDALNDISYVQYNYVHDNYGGFMMWCNVSPFYPSYDGIVRYNISENDHMKVHGIFDVFPDMYGSETYNNVFYMNPETALNEQGQLKFFNHSNATKDEHKVFNNIFYLSGNAAHPVETWGNTAINWQNNIFYNIEGAPAGTNMNVDPQFVDPGKGYDPVNKPITAFRGLDQMRKDLEGYKLQENSPAIDAGVWCPSMSKGVPVDMLGVDLEEHTIPMHDFFGKTVTGIPDIGAHESDYISGIKVISKAYTVDQEQNVITVNDTTSIQNLMDSLLYNDQLDISLVRGTVEPDQNGYLLAGDVLHVAKQGGSETRDYTINVVKQTRDGEIPVDQLSVVAGNSDSHDPAQNVLKNDGTIWHTSWGGTDRANQWIYLKINDGAPAYKVTGLSFLPRQDASANGVITSYKILGSNDGTDWTEITQGSWDAADRSRKIISLDAEQQTYTYYKLVSLASETNSTAQFSSLQEMRLLGHETAAEAAPAAPAGVAVENVTASTAVVTWTTPADVSGIKSYVVKDAEGQILAAVPADAGQAVLTGLTAGTTYTGLTVSAENTMGVVSEAAAIPAFTTVSDTQLFRVAGTSVVLESDLKMLFAVNKTDLNGKQGVYAVVTHTDATGKKTDTRVDYVDWIESKDGTQMCTKFNGLSAKEMADQLEVVIYDQDGTALSEVYTASIQDYAKKVLADPEYQNMYTLVVDMLNYGAAAQTHFGYNLGNLANAFLTNEQKALATQEAPAADARVAGANYYTTSLSLDNRIVLNLYFQNVTRDMRAQVTYTDHYGNLRTHFIEGDKFVEIQGGKALGVPVNQLAVADTQQMVTCVIYNGDVKVAEVTDSMAGYAARAMEKSTDANLKDLMGMLVKFGKSSAEFFRSENK